MTQPLYIKNGKLFVLDQRLLPHEVRYVEVRSADDGFSVIAKMIVRGAPLIGITAFYALAAEAKRAGKGDIQARLLRKAARVNSVRPTAVNLNFAVAEFIKLVRDRSGAPGFAEIAAAKAAEFHDREIKATRQIAKNGARLIKKGSAVMTYCNAGALAAPDHGTALGVIFEAYMQGRIREVFTCETRPYLQGMRLTSFELSEAKIPHRIISDNTAGFLMKKGMVGAVVVGADRIAANGDTANKIGTFSLAVLARYHNIPFYVAAPMTTIDLSLRTGAEIPIEERSDSELLNIRGKRAALKDAKGLYYGFDVTDKDLITAIITEKGVVSPVNAASLKKLAGKK